MKSQIILSFAFLLMSCNQTSEVDTQSSDHTNSDNKEFLENYLKTINQPDWEEHIQKYLDYDATDFIADHRNFRNAFKDYHAEIKHHAVDKDYGLAWITVTAIHAGVYDGLYDVGRETQQIAPTNKKISWDEVWYYTFDGNKFTPEFELMTQDLVRMRQLGVTKVPN